MPTVIIKPDAVVKNVIVKPARLIKTIVAIKQGPSGAKGDTGLPNLGKEGELIQFVSGEFIAKHQWITLATAFTADPALLFSNAATEIYQYQYGSTVLYRSITDALDGFYQAYDPVTHAVTGLVAYKQTSIAV